MDGATKSAKAEESEDREIVAVECANVSERWLVDIST